MIIPPTKGNSLMPALDADHPANELVGKYFTNETEDAFLFVDKVSRARDLGIVVSHVHVTRIKEDYVSVERSVFPAINFDHDFREISQAEFEGAVKDKSADLLDRLFTRCNAKREATRTG